MAKSLVIRFGSLGDLCLLGWALAAHRDRQQAFPSGFRKHDTVTLATKPAFADLMSHMWGIDRVQVPADTSFKSVAELARHLKAQNFDTIADAHNILRSHLLLGLMGRRPTCRLAKDTAARLLFLRTKKSSPALDRHMIDRFESLMGSLESNCTSPLEGLKHLPLASLREPGSPPSSILGLAPGAQWDTKRWPPEHFKAFAQSFLADGCEGIRIFLGPREEAWFSTSPLKDLAHYSRVEIIRQRSLVDAARLLAGCRALVTNDSGLLHLSEAVGTPVLALFGPTVKQFGYFPHLPHSCVMEESLGCRPCSRNGKRPCHRQDLACLANISPEAVLNSLRAMWSDITSTEPS